MTILCLVRNQKNDTWAALADSLITSDGVDEGDSLAAPLPLHYREKRTFGFGEAAFEEKIGLVDQTTLLGWSGTRQVAVEALNNLRMSRTETDSLRALKSPENCYLLVQRNEIGEYVIKFFGRKDSYLNFRSGDYEYFAAGSGRKILDGIRFNAYAPFVGDEVTNPGWAAMQIAARFLLEEMTGNKSQFYSLRTGGPFRIFCGGPEGIRQLHYSISNWTKEDSAEPVVKRLFLPFAKDGFECLVDLQVDESWNMTIVNAIALSPMLESPRKSRKIQLSVAEVLASKMVEATIHMCWTEQHLNPFISSYPEPVFRIEGNGFAKEAHLDKTLEIVEQLLDE